MKHGGYAILGGSGGIGSEVARRLTEQGQRVIIGARNTDRLREVAHGLEVPFEAVDALAPDGAARFVARAVQEFGELDGVLNCVGSIHLKPLHATSDEEWREVLETNLFTSFALLRAAVPHLRKSGGAAVLCSSVAATTGLVNHEAIAAAKAGVEGLARSAAATYARWGVRVNVVAPGLVRTPMTEGLLANDVLEQASVALHPLGRIGVPSDIASAITWLLSPEQSWISGQVIHVDGGLSRLKTRPHPQRS